MTTAVSTRMIRMYGDARRHAVRSAQRYIGGQLEHDRGHCMQHTTQDYNHTAVQNRPVFLPSCLTAAVSHIDSIAINLFHPVGPGMVELRDVMASLFVQFPWFFRAVV